MIKKINDWTLNIDDDLYQKINNEYLTLELTPKKENLFKVYEIVKKSEVNVVFLGQDPYPKKGDANGIAFSVNRNNKLPASLRNIYKEIETDLGIKRIDGDLTNIVKQGVLFMNTVLTTEVGKARSHHNYGWQKTTNEIITDLSNKGNIIFVLLGNDAKAAKKNIDINNNIIIESSHPSPLSAYRGFLGSKIFSQINNELSKLKKPIIDWNK